MILKKLNPFEFFNIWPTTQQLFNTTVFLLLGKLVLGITITWVEIAVALVSGFMADYLVSRIKGEPKPFLHCSSGIVTSFATCVLLRSVDLYVLPLVVILGVGQKYFLRVKGKHFHNPSNLAVLAALILFPNTTYLDFNAWGSKYFSLGLVIVCAVLLLTRVRLLRVSAASFLIYTAFNYLFVSSSPIVLFKAVTSTTFLLYAFFIINDPMSLPKTDRFRFLHVLVVISSTFFLFLFWGKKDVNIPLGLFASSFLVPYWRSLEVIKIKRRYFPEGIAFALILLISIGFYNSSLNLKDNLKNSYESLKSSDSSQSEEQVPSALKREPVKDFSSLWKIDSSLFEKSWEVGHVFSRDLLESSSSNKLELLNNEVSKIKKDVSLEKVGFEFLPYSPIGAGDINKDGLTDLVIGSPTGEVYIYLNKGGNQYQDITQNVFDIIPNHTEQVTLADFNNDSYLDLLLIGVHYDGLASSVLYLFDPELKKFVPKLKNIGKGKFSSGGVSVTDINKDGHLDFYISFGANWLSEDPNMVNADVGFDEFYVSSENGWSDQIAQYFPKRLSKKGYVGMTALFSDLDLNGKTNFLLGNDFFDPSFFMEFDSEIFKLKDKDNIQLNTISSMSYFNTDLNSDGVFEIWENGISNSPPNMKKFNGLNIETSVSVPATDLQKEVKKLTEFRVNFEYQCDSASLTTSFSKEICKARVLGKIALEKDSVKECDNIQFKSLRAECIRFYTASKSSIYASKRTSKFEVEKFPKQLKTNVLLELKENGKYESSIPDSLLYTGWSWATYPFDLNNDGLQDLYITNGYLDLSHDTNKLFMNGSDRNQFNFKDMAAQLKVDFEDNARGLIITDLDNDGDGDIVINNFDTSPRYLKNNLGGDSVQFELRGRTSYYAIGSTVRIKTSKRTQVRQVKIGGIWNSSQPSRLHFGLDSGEVLKEVEVLWYDGSTSLFKDLKASKIHTIYQ